MDIKFLSFKPIILIFLLIHNCVGPPAKNKQNGDSKKDDDSKAANFDDLGLEYNRYLSEVVNVLESDPDFRKKLETADEADFRNGKIAAELEYVSHHVRTKLDELKRIELQRLRDLIHKSEELDRNEVNPNHVNPGHIDHSNPHTFESADLHKLITQVRQDLAEADRNRREDFKQYEMQKKFEQEEKIKSLDEEHKKQYLHDLEEQQKQHKEHKPLHHPGSRNHLEGVWEQVDHMQNQKFNPRTFFMLHDVNGDGYWDEDEVKALFLMELDYAYKPGAPGTDMREREEEMERMREHLFKEVDTNGDRLIGYEEFLKHTKDQDFQQSKEEGWNTLDTQTQFTQQEYEEFERRRHKEIQDLINQGLLQPYAPGMMPPPGYAPHPAQYQQAYAPAAPQQYGHNVGYPQGVPPQHGQGVPPQHGQGVPPQHGRGVPPQHGQGVPYHPQGVPPQPQYAPQGQYQNQQYQGQYQNLGHPQGNQPPQHQVPPQNVNQASQQKPAPPQPVPVQQKQAYYNNQAPINPQVSQNQQSVNVGQQQAVGANAVPNQGQQAQQQQYQPDPNQIPPAVNQASNQQYNQPPPPPVQPNQNPPQPSYGSNSQQKTPTFQQGNVNQNQVHSDNNLPNSNIPKN